MALWKASTTKSEWGPDDPTAFAPTKPWKLPFITTWGGSPNRNLPTNSAEEALFAAYHKLFSLFFVMGNNSLAYTRNTAVKTFTGSEKTLRLRYVVIRKMPGNERS